MARKGNQQRNGLDCSTSKHKFKVSESVGVSFLDKKGNSKAHESKVSDNGEVPISDLNCRSSSPLQEKANITKNSGNGKRKNQRSNSTSRKEKSEEVRTPNIAQSVSSQVKISDNTGNAPLSDASESRGVGISLDGNHTPKASRSRVQDTSTVGNAMDGSWTTVAVAARSLGALVLLVLRTANGWVESQKPRIATFATVICDARDYIRFKIAHAYPIIRTWILYVGKIMFLLSMVWLDCSLRGLGSLVRMGTTSIFAVVWCSVLSVLAMIGISKMLMIMVLAILVAVFIGFALAIAISAIFAIVILWIYGSFWISGLVVLCGGISFALGHDRAALFVTTVYSMYCAGCYVGWLGLLLGLNLSFISSDILIHFLKNNITDHRSNSSSEQSRKTQSRGDNFYNDPVHSSSVDDVFQSASGRSTGIPSTSGAETELTSEDEVVRLLNCSDHYSVLSLARFENVDASFLKREYRKKAMLVHPDKNMGNEKAAEAFKKLQNAYEVLLDSIKRKTYDDELKREELLNYFRRFQSTSQKKGRHGIFQPGFAQGEAEDEGLHGESRRIACKKCGDYHVWACTSRSKSRARWCQDCKDFHQAKDGDGWVEQSFQPLLFGLLHKVDSPRAYVCAESRIYDATEWFICQGMKCPANAHKSSFHVNTSIASRHSNAKGTSSGGGIPNANMDETMTEDEFFEWLQNAMQSGMFEASSTSNDSPSPRTGSCSKSAGKKKKKGKRQW